MTIDSITTDPELIKKFIAGADEQVAPEEVPQVEGEEGKKVTIVDPKE